MSLPTTVNRAYERLDGRRVQIHYCTHCTPARLSPPQETPPNAFPQVRPGVGGGTPAFCDWRLARWSS